ncbi:hypothetical protein QUF63_09090 [Anaerolineales bacterium HSG25]|nr:hypothetical protein [Anaerolineales bacterium HSG25]
MHVQTSDATKLLLAGEIGRGGEARVLNVSEQAGQVAKIYYQSSPERELKLKAMLANPPRQPHQHTAIAWPTDLLYQNDNFIGFLMPKVQGSEPVFNIYNPARRQKQGSQFNRQALHRIAHNLVTVVKAIHAKGHVIGDLNESNILVNSQALVTLVDTDSFQVTAPSGQIHRCEVGKSEYTAPEMQGKSFKDTDQQQTQDYFSLAVLVFQLLMEGFHPFAGVLTSQVSVGRVDLYCIKQGLFPYKQSSLVKPPPNAPPFETLDQNLQSAFIRCFADGHHAPNKRPSTVEWQQLLHQAEQNLVTCSTNHQHVYANHNQHCPWCERQKKAAEKHTIRKRSVQRAIYRPARPAQQAFAPMPEPSVWRGRIQLGLMLALLPTMGVIFLMFTGAGSDSAVTPNNEGQVSEVVPLPQSTEALSTTLIDNTTNARLVSGTDSLIPINQNLLTLDVAFLPDGQRVVGISSAGAWLYDLARKAKINALTPNGEVISMALSPDGLLLAAGIEGGDIWLWELETGQRRFILNGHADTVSSLSFSSDGQTLASGSHDRTIKLWDINDSSLIRTFSGHDQFVTSVVFIPGQTGVASGSWDQTLRLWQTDKGLLNIETFRGNEAWITSVTASPDGKIIASGDIDGQIRLWRVADRLPIQTLDGHTSTIKDLAFSPDGTLLASGSDDHAVSLWQVSTGKRLTTGQVHNNSVTGVAFSPDGTKLISSSMDRTVRVWQVK